VYYRKDEILPSPGQQKPNRSFSQNPLTDVLIENLPEADHCYYFPFKTDRKPEEQVQRRLQHPSEDGENHLCRAIFATPFPEAKIQGICPSCEWIFL